MSNYDRLKKNTEILRITNVLDLPDKYLDFHLMQFIDYTDDEVQWANKKFGVDFSIIKHYEDIEISSHFSVNEKQISFHLSMPFYDEVKNIVDTPILFVIATAGLFFFSNSDIDNYSNKRYPQKFSKCRSLEIQEIF